MRATLLSIISDGEWTPSIGDPTLVGWLTVAAYFLAGSLCAWTGRRSRESRSSRAAFGDTLFWFACAAVMLALGVNKQLDLQTWMTVLGKKMALAQGWYEQRRVVQTVFVGLVAGLGTLALLATALLARWATSAERLAMLGGVFLLAFIVVRAASFHHVDQMLGTRLAGLKMNAILELSGIAGVAGGAWLNERHRRRMQPKSG